MSESRTPAILYAAKSTQDKRGSIPTQLAECRAMAAENGWEVVGEFHDEGFSAYSGNRGPGLAAARERAAQAAAEYGTPAMLVAQHSDRFSRGGGDKPGAAEALVEIWHFERRRDVHLRSVEDDFDLTTSVTVANIGERNRADSERKSKAVSKGMARRRERGLHAGRAPYGYIRDKEAGLLPDPSQAPTVRRIFELVAAGKSQAEVARILNREGSRPQQGMQWMQGSISKVLRSRTYLGEIRTPAGEWLPGIHEPLVSQELWEEANAKREAAAGLRGRRGGRRPKAGHLLTGRMLRHSACGSAMTPRSGDPQRDGSISGWYVCSGRKAGLCEGLTVEMAAVDGAIVGHLAEVGIDVDRTLELVREATSQKRAAIAAELAAARRELATAEESLKRVSGDYLAGKLPIEDWLSFKPELEEGRQASAAKVAQLERRAAEAEREPEEYVPAVTDAFELIRDAIHGGDSSAVQSALEGLFESFLIGDFPDPPDDLPEALRTRLAAMKREAAADLSGSDALALPSGVVILPQPRENAFASICEDGSPVLLVDKEGQRVFRRMPLRVTNNESFDM